jgi:hypothetical protein
MALPATNRSLVLLTLVVTAAHLGVAGTAWPDRLGEGAGEGAARKSIDVSFVRELLPAEPPAAPPPRTAAPAPRPASVAAPPPPPAASAPSAEPAPSLEPTPAVDPAPVAAAPETAPIPPPVAEAAPPAAEAPGPAAAFEWPPSTRLSYTVAGEYRGPVEGQASVEWRREGTRYEVDLNIEIGPAFAPLVARSITSSGELTAGGLRPARYDETTKIVLRPPLRLVVEMGEEMVVLAGGRQVPRPANLQDSASQFVQLTWLFTTDPGRLREGQQIELPLALPRRLGLWVYEVGASEPVATPRGPVEAVHVKPRRDAGPRRGGAGAGELAAEAWFAPSLQYLPVRMLIRQGPESWVELKLASWPQQAAPPAAPASATGR